MMLLRNYLAENTLINNTYNVINYDYLASRLRVRYGNRPLRKDLTITDIAIYAQNTIDINIDFFRNLLDNVINPYETWGETETHENNGETTNTNSTNGETTVNHSGSVEHTNDGTITDNNNGETTNSGTSSGSNPTTTQTNNKVNAYNSTTSVPYDESETIVTATNETNYNDKQVLTGNNTQTRELSAKDIYNNSDKTTTDNNSNGKQINASNGNYSKKGYNISDYDIALHAYNSAYDIIIDYIVRDILQPIADLWVVTE